MEQIPHSEHSGARLAGGQTTLMGKSNTGTLIYNYNGEGRWTVAAVQTRYIEYCREYGVKSPIPPVPRKHMEGQKHWLYPVMEAVIEGIERGDKASIALGLDFIEEDAHFPFGKTLKSNTARALRRASLTADQVLRVRKRVTNLLVAGQIPHEFREYAKLLRHVGLAECWPVMQRDAKLDNPFVRRFVEYFRACAEREHER
jgi:hypothetical protein